MQGTGRFEGPCTRDEPSHSAHRTKWITGCLYDHGFACACGFSWPRGRPVPKFRRSICSAFARVKRSTLFACQSTRGELGADSLALQTVQTRAVCGRQTGVRPAFHRRVRAGYSVRPHIGRDPGGWLTRIAERARFAASVGLYSTQVQPAGQVCRAGTDGEWTFTGSHYRVRRRGSASGCSRIVLRMGCV